MDKKTIKPINVLPNIETVDLQAIKPWLENPRGIEDEALDGLRQSLERFGLVNLLVVNRRNMQLISGHQRRKLLIDAEIESVPCVMVDLDELAQQALAVTLNNQEIAGYFTAALIPILERMRQEMPEDYLALRMAELRDELDQMEVENLGKTAPDDIPQPPHPAIAKLGDLWILGEHRLLCGDSTDPIQVDRLMNGEKAALMATDPPYCIDYTGADRPGGGKDWTDLYREIDIKDAVAFWNKFMEQALRVTHEDAAVYFWYASSKYIEMERVFKNYNLLLHQSLIWVKPCINLTFSIYPWRHEPCAFGWRKGNRPYFRSHRKNVGTVWTTQFLRSCDPETAAYYTDVWEVDYEGRKRPESGMHPTVKPTEVFAIPMRVHTRPGDICYEPFSGSGSQIIAAERVNRRCYAIELQPVFVDVAVRRWEEFTGKKAWSA